MPDELLRVVCFLEGSFYMQWRMDNDPRPVFQFFDGSFEPLEGDTVIFLQAMSKVAISRYRKWGNYDPSEMEDWVQDYRIGLGFKTLGALKAEIESRGLELLSNG